MLTFENIHCSLPNEKELRNKERKIKLVYTTNKSLKVSKFYNNHNKHQQKFFAILHFKISK